MTQQQRLALTEIFSHLPFSITGDPVEQRVKMEAALTRIPLAGDVTVATGSLGGIPVLIIDSQGVDTSKVLLHFHGGVYVLGSARAGAGLAAALGRSAGMRVISVDYRLAPENPYPAALDDAVAAYRAALEQTPTSHLAVSGESAGGGLATALMVRLAAEDLPLPAASVLLSPWVDLTLAGDTMVSKASIDPSVLTPEGLRERVPDYVGDVDPATPLVSPIFADLTGLPPTLIQVGSHEILLDDAVRLAGVAAAHDVNVTLQVTPKVPHVFQAFAAILDEGKAAVEQVGAFLRAYVGMVRSD
ncbi:alpha/beta hydrolase [Demequina lutea]|uniref:Acetyl esterase/lipase n=1 Tax=Demequina lutea TaxID=431489 RepID=A0A7Y9ZAH3_9MICO|nr:alpha/beta hydrolase [Demequina lutea]NYI40983.1 acetyl esterase/lipase [Demequina lutea]